MKDFFANPLLRHLFALPTAFVISVIAGRMLINFFRRRQVIEDTTQPDHAGLNEIQSKKKNVPTMGGLMIVAGIVGSVLLWSDLSNRYVQLGLLVAVILGALGFADDYIKLRCKPSRGLSKKSKLIVQFALGGLVGLALLALARGQLYGDSIFLFGGLPISLGWWYILWAAFVMAAASNAVNLTDGLDGLAGGLSVIALLALVIIGAPFCVLMDHFLAGSGIHEEMILFCLAAAGAVLGFLWYNAHPAQIFMGDTGSLMLGGLLGYLALAMKMDLLLFVVAAVFFIDELTVALQIACFKLTKKRLFPITPIHHYFQVHLGWPEEKIVFRFWLAGAVAAWASITLLLVCNGNALK